MNIAGRMILVTMLFTATEAFAQDSPEKMFSMSFEELMSVKVTTGTKYETSIRETHAAVRLISSEEIQTYGIETLGELLNLVRGFYISNDRNYTYVGVQGFSRPTDYNNRFLLMIDNHILNENVYGSVLMENGFGLNVQLIDRVEVITGPGAALYGNGAMMAVVHVLTKAGDGAENKVRLHAGNNNTFGSSFVLRDQKKSSSWYASGNVHRSSGETLFFPELAEQGNNGSAVDLDDEEVYAAYVKYNNQNFGVKLLGTHRMKGIPTGPWEARLDDRSESVDQRAFVEFEYNKSFSGQSLKAAVSWDLYRYTGKYAYPDLDYRDRSVGSWGNIQVEYHLELNTRNRLMAGGEWHYAPKSDYMEEQDGEESFYRNNEFNNYSLFAQYDYVPNEKLRLLAGLRLDNYSYTTMSLSPRLSAIYTPHNNMSISYSFNKAFRAPNFYEMFYEAEGENVPNSDLTPEVIYYNNLNVRTKITNNLRGGTSLFLYKMDKLIDPVATDEDLVMFINKGNATGKGIQFILEGNLFKNVSFLSSYTLQELTITDLDGNKNRATNFPVNLFKAHFAYYMPKVGSLGLQNHWESGRKMIDEGKTSSSWVSALNLRTVRFFHRFIVNFKVNNVFDAKYYHPAGMEHLMGQIVQPRRNYVISAEIKL